LCTICYIQHQLLERQSFTSRHFAYCSLESYALPMLSKQLLLFFFLSLVALIKFMSTLILFVHNSSWEITTLFFYSNYIKYIRFVLKKSNHFFVSFFQNLLRHATIHKLYLDFQTIIALSLRSYNSLCFCLDGSILMDHEWMENFFISLILYVLFEQ
jgi:hypothetical protein